MKANELMIGDWVYMKSHKGFESQNIKVETIPDASSDVHYGHIGAYPISEDMDFRDIEDSHLEPIPLTPEILEKNGFVLFDSNWWYGDLRISISYSLVCGKLLHFKYVHELQHVLRLCGFNKEIIL